MSGSARDSDSPSENNLKCLDALLRQHPMCFPNKRVGKYMSIPFVDGGRDMSGCDCWGLVYLIYKHEFNIQLPTYGDIPAKELIRIRSQIESDKSQSTWARVDAGEELTGDIVVLTGTMRTSGSTLRNALVHVGLVTKPRFILHTEKGFGVTHVPFRGSGATQAITCRVREIYRWNLVLQ